MTTVRVTPETFELVPFDAAAIAAVTVEIARRIGAPSTVEIDVEVDETIPMPLSASAVDAIDGRVCIWIAGANLEDRKRPGRFSAARAEVEIGRELLRGLDRLGPDFADAPPDDDVDDLHRFAWLVHADGRLARHGVAVSRGRDRYDFRLYHGFSDVADAAFERCWNAESLAWADLDEICATTAAADTRPKTKPRPSLRARLRAHQAG